MLALSVEISRQIFPAAGITIQNPFGTGRLSYDYCCSTVRPCELVVRVGQPAPHVLLRIAVQVRQYNERLVVLFIKTGSG